jgi:hypothetical protein
VLSQLRRRKKMRRVRRFVALALVLAAVLAWVTGLFSASVAAAADLLDTARISMTPAAGFPATTGVTDLYQLEPLTGGFVELGTESCVVYTDGGTRLRNIQAGYARPAIAAGTTRFILYNRGGTELRVESRTRTLYTKDYENSILLAAIAANGSFAVVTGHSSYLAELTMYTASMETRLTWDMTDTEGTPLRMAFGADSQRLAVVTLTARNGQVAGNLYLLRDGQQARELATEEGGVPLALRWLSRTSLLVLYDTCAVAYSTSDGSELGRFDYGGRSLSAWSVSGGQTALALSGGSSESIVLLSDRLVQQASADVGAARGITLTKTAVYTLTDSAVECWSLDGEYLWKQECAAKPQALLEEKQLLCFAGDSVSVCAAPAEN